MSSFGSNYSEYYDVLYSDKDYEAECDYIETIFHRFSLKKVGRVLDVACGTGGHAIPLAKRGFGVVATDISKHMLGQARRKIDGAAFKGKLDLKTGDMRVFRPLGRFDACLSMFAAIGYLSSYEDLLAALRTMHRHLRPGGLLIFDFWNGIAVLRVLPSARRKRIARREIVVTRDAKPKLDVLRNACDVKYSVTVSESRHKRQRFSELHHVRFYFPEEISLLLRLSRFKLISLHPFLHLDRKIRNSDWNLTAVSRAI